MKFATYLQEKESESRFGFKKENEYWVFDTEQTIKSADHIKIIKNE